MKVDKTDNPSNQDLKRAGLTDIEAAARLKEYGPNEPVKTRRRTSLIELLRLFSQPLVVILLLAALFSGLLGNLVNSVIIVTMVILSVGLNFIQTTRTQKVTERLRRTVSPTATILRNGRWLEVKPSEIVPDDIIRLVAGDVVPADSFVLESKDLHVQEAALTGESLPVRKDAEGSEKDRMVYLGTSVMTGFAIVQAKLTGERTAFGEIAKSLSYRKPETEFERGNREFSYLIARIIFVLVLFAFFVNTFFHRDPLESLLFSIALAVGLTPEFLPMITTVTLGQGAMRMARQKTIVKHLETIQNFGSMDILCSDKTGTLTRGELSLIDHVNPLGTRSDKPLILGFLNSKFQSGISEPDNTALSKNSNPLDKVILEYRAIDISSYKKIDELPLDFERRRMSVVVETMDGRRMLICKGAPESVLPVCDRTEADGEIQSWNDAQRGKTDGVFKDLSNKGFRVLAVAYREISHQEKYDSYDEYGLILAGFLVFADEPIVSAGKVLRRLRQDGVQVKIITGDNPSVTQHVCREVGLPFDRIVLGDEIDHMSDTALAVTAEEANVFARVSPMQKNRILLALKSRGHVVGFLGDGINDAPSLRTADVGISVSTATDVAKDAAEVILLEQSLSTLHTGIIEGRKSFGNVMKYILMGTSSNFGNMFSMAAATLFLPFLPLLPVQIILNNFLYDIAQVTIATDNVDSTFIRKPHHWDLSLIRNFMWSIGPISSIFDFLTFYILLNFFHADEQFFHTGWFIESLTTQTLVVFLIRTAQSSFKSRPSRALTLTVLGVVVVGIALPLSPLAVVFGFAPLPIQFYLFLVLAVAIYLLIVELIKRRLMRHLIR